MKIESQLYEGIPQAMFSILIPTWNNLPYLQCCIESLRKHSHFPHQIIVHVNDGSDGSLAWVRSQRIDHTWSTENVGVCHALNAAAKLARTDYVCFFNDDMYALPGWDGFLCQEIDGLTHDRWFLSATMIEPTDTGNPAVLAPHDYGRDTQSLDENRLLREYAALEKDDWSGATWPPNVVPKSLWDEVGGYSVEFTPGMSSDPDFSMKLWQTGVRHFKGIGKSRVYHFQTKSTGKVQKNNGPRQFLQKWKLTQGSFATYYLRRGKPWKGPLHEPGPILPLLMARIKSFFKRQFLR